MKRWLPAMLLIASLILTACPAPTPQIIEVEKQVPVEKVVVETVEVVKEVPVEKVVKETVEVVKEIVVEPDYVTLRTNWIFGGAHAWLFYGRDQGYFREQNLVVDIREYLLHGFNVIGIGGAYEPVVFDVQLGPTLAEKPAYAVGEGLGLLVVFGRGLGYLVAVLVRAGLKSYIVTGQAVKTRCHIGHNGGVGMA